MRKVVVAAALAALVPTAEARSQEATREAVVLGAKLRGAFDGARGPRRKIPKWGPWVDPHPIPLSAQPGEWAPVPLPGPRDPRGIQELLLETVPQKPKRVAVGLFQSGWEPEAARKFADGVTIVLEKFGQEARHWGRRITWHAERDQSEESMRRYGGTRTREEHEKKKRKERESWVD